MNSIDILRTTRWALATSLIATMAACCGGGTTPPDRCIDDPTSDSPAPDSWLPSVEEGAAVTPAEIRIGGQVVPRSVDDAGRSARTTTGEPFPIPDLIIC